MKTPLLLCVLLVTLSCAFGASIKVAFVYSGPINDFGYSYSHELARVAVEKHFINLGVNITTAFRASVAVNDSEAVFREFANDGYDLIVATGSQFGAQIHKVADEFPQRKFIAINNGVPTNNVAVGFPALWEGSYLLGLTCGLSTKTNKVGYVGAFANLPSHTRSINAFAIGAREANPNVEILLGTPNSFLDPLTENKTANEIVKLGVDCLVSQVNDDTPNKVASEFGVFSAGYASDDRFFAGEYVLTSVVFNWVPYYIHWIDNVLNGAWVANESIYWGIKDGAVELAYWSTSVSSATRKRVEDRLEELRASTNESIFCGTYATQFVAGAKCLTLNQILPMKTLVDTVQLRVNLTRADVIQYVYVAWSDPAAIVFVILVSILLVAALLSMVDLAIFRHTTAYRASSPLFCGLILVGIILMYISLFFWVGMPTNAMCMLRAWFGGIGFNLVFTCIICKNWRLWRIFEDKSFKVFAISNNDLLLKWILPVVGTETIILILWQALDPLQGAQILPTSPIDPHVNMICASNSPAPLIVFLVYKGVLLLPAAMLSYATRRITGDFKESETIGVSVFLAGVIGLLVLGVDIIVSSTQVVAFFIVSVFGILVIAGTLYTIIFVPKAWRVHVLGDKEPFTYSRSSASARGSTNKTNSQHGTAQQLSTISQP